MCALNYANLSLFLLISRSPSPEERPSSSTTTTTTNFDSIVYVIDEQPSRYNIFLNELL